MSVNKSPFNRKKAEISVKQSEKEAEILIYDEIGFFGIQAKDFVESLDALEVETLHVRINSPGGSVWDGMAIYNALKRYDGLVMTHVDGVALSAASFIALAGDEVVMGEGAFLMIHDPWSIVVGTAEDMRKEAQVLDKHAGAIAAIYAGKTGMELDEVNKLMAEETWMTPDEAIELGFADRKEEASKISAGAFDLSIYAKVPDVLKSGDHKGIPTKRDIERMLTREAGLSSEQAKAFLSKGYNALSGTREAAEEGYQVPHELRAVASTIFK